MSSPDAPPPIGPSSPLPVPEAVPDARTGGCMRWGLLGCALLSVLAIVGTVLFLRKAPQIMERLLGATEAQVVAAIEPDVPVVDREAFRAEYAAFVATAKAGKARPEGIQELQRKIASALEDRKVTAEELKALTEQLRSLPKT